MVFNNVQRPRIKRTIETFISPQGDLRLVQPAAENDLVVQAPTAEEQALLRALDGTNSLPALEKRFGTREVGETISQLRELEVVEDAADDDLIPTPERERFDRQLRYFSDMAGSSTTPSQCQARLRDARVAMLGVGGLGSWAALALACSGVGEMWLIDGDRLETSNLNRQILYTEAEVGLLKAEAAAARLRAFNSSMRITATARRLESKTEMADFIAGADVVVATADWPAFEIERWCNAACFEADIPYISMSHSSRIARVGPFYVPGSTGCSVCQEIALKREHPLLEAAIENMSNDASEAATLGAACGLIGGQVGMEVMHLLTGLSHPATLGVAHNYDLRTMEVSRHAILPQAECPVCSHLPHRQ